MEFEHLAWIGHWEIQEITFTSVFIIVKCKQLVLFFLRYTQIIRNTILKLGKTVCLDMQRVVIWVTRAFLVFSYPSFINSFWNAPSNSSGTINHALVKVTYITFFPHSDVWSEHCLKLMTCAYMILCTELLPRDRQIRYLHEWADVRRFLIHWSWVLITILVSVFIVDYWIGFLGGYLTPGLNFSPSQTLLTSYKKKSTLDFRV